MLLQIDPVLSLYFNGQLLVWSLAFLSINTIIGPALSLIILKKRGMIDSLTMPELKGRSLAYLIVFLYHVWNFIMFKKVDIPSILQAMLIGLLVVLAVLALVSLVWKISAHMAAAGGMLSIIVWLYLFYGMFSFSLTFGGLLLVGLVGTSRLYLNAHNHAQLAAGFSLGFLTIITALLTLT